MQKLRKIFFETKMTWWRVIVLSLIAAVVTAAVMIVPFLNNTSISYLGVTTEAWFLIALYIILNCQKPLEAGIKTFVFFLISQPLIYLLQVPFSTMGWELFGYYRFWFIMTILTFPGAILAWYVKKDNIWSALLMSVATADAAVSFVQSLTTVLTDFPGELIRVIFTLAEMLLFIFVLLQNKRGRLVCGIITLAVIVATAFTRPHGAPKANCQYELDDTCTWEITETEGYLGRVEVVGNDLEVYADRFSAETVTLTNDRGETAVFYITYAPPNHLNITNITE